MKKILLATVFSVCSVFSVTNANTLRFGTEATFAPFEFTDDKSNIIGYDVDIIKAIGQAEGFDVEVVNMPFDALIPSVLTSQLDGAIAGITITEERAKQVAFSDPYYKSGISAVIRAEDESKYTTIDSLSNSRLCAQIGTTGANAAKELTSGNVGFYNTVPESFMELKNKGCEAVFNDRPVNLYFLITSKDNSFVEVKELINGEDYGIVLNKNNTELLNKINSGLKKIRENGTFSAIHEKWFKVKE
ncbi:MAG: basic amino acid ABC transporter substrate-binding protein [Succinivibrio sp.]